MHPSFSTVDQMHGNNPDNLPSPDNRRPVGRQPCVESFVRAHLRYASVYLGY